VIYNDAAGQPGTYFAVSSEVVISAGAALAEVDFTGFDHTALTNGQTMWLGLWSGPNTQPGAIACATGASGIQKYESGHPYSSTGAAPTVSSPADYTNNYWAYITYTTAGTTYTKTGAAVAKLYGRGSRTGGRAVFPKTGAGVAKLYGTGAKALGAGYLSTTSPLVPFRQQANPGAYLKTGAAAARLYGTGAKQYLLGGTGVLYQKTGAGANRAYATGRKTLLYLETGAGLARLYGSGARTGGTIPPPVQAPLSVLRDAVLTVAGFDLSDHVDSVTITTHRGVMDVTCYGDTGLHYAPALRTDQFQAVFLQDFGANKVHAVIAGLLSSSGFTVSCKPRTGVVSATNPLFSATCIILDYTPLGAKAGDRSDAPVTFQAVTPITQATS
jgi:hypothetical protein